MQICTRGAERSGCPLQARFKPSLARALGVPAWKRAKGYRYALSYAQRVDLPHPRGWLKAIAAEARAGQVPRTLGLWPPHRTPAGLATAVRSGCPSVVLRGRAADPLPGCVPERCAPLAARLYGASCQGHRTAAAGDVRRHPGMPQRGSLGASEVWGRLH